jgi:tRNA modification GTPase
LPGSKADDRPCFAVLTPEGQGAIATVAVRGARAVDVVSRLFQPASGTALTGIPLGRVVFGRFQATSATCEELVVGLVEPGEIEIHCHGGKAAVEAVCEALAGEGACRLAPEQWVRSQEGDPIAANALLALAAARTERTAGILLDQYRGALRKEIDEIRTALVRGDYSVATSGLDDLLARAEAGLHLTQPWKVVIAGAPNAGKSSLMNAIVGYRRSIVWHEPGTTRDVLSASTAIDGWPVEILDTAGLRASSEPLEAEGVARAEAQIASADLMLFVADVSEPWAEAVYEKARRECRRAPIVVHNKCDLVAGEPSDRPEGLKTSAVTGEGLDSLCQAIAEALVPVPPPAGAAVPFTFAQVAALTAAVGHVKNKNEDCRAAQLQLDNLTVH